MGYKDPVRQKEFQHKYYQDNKELCLQRSYSSRQRRKKLINDYKVSKGCAHCGDKREPVLEFHHLEARNGDEYRCIGTMLHRAGLEKIYKELEQCLVLCANCHRMLHSQ